MLEIRYILSSNLNTFNQEKDWRTIIVMPSIDIVLAKKAAQVMSIRTNEDALLMLIEDDLRLGFISVTNSFYKKTKSIYFSYVAQDVFAGYYWLEYALQSLEKGDAGILAFSDGRFFGNIATFGLVKRTWVDTIYNGDIFYHKYNSHFADTELSIIAREQHKLVFNPNAILMEVDYAKHLHGNNYDDEKLFFKRARNGFDKKIKPFIPELSDEI